MFPLRDALAHAVRLTSAERYPAAQAVLVRVLAVHPGDANALHLMGVCAGRNGGSEQATTLLERAFAVVPGSMAVRENLAAAHVLSGLAHLSDGRTAKAATSFQRALALRPDDTGTWGNLATALSAGQRFDEALGALHRLAALSPDREATFSALGQILTTQEKPQAAAAAYRRAAVLAPEAARGWLGLGTAWHAAGDAIRARSALWRALALEPDADVAWHRLSQALTPAGEAERSVVMAMRSLRLRHDRVNTWLRLADARDAVVDHPGAQEAGRRAVALAPDDPGAWGALVKPRGPQSSVAGINRCWRHICALLPDNVQAHWGYAFSLLLHGELREGWREYEWRLRLPEATLRHFEQPRWTGEDLHGRTILLHREQGLGDLIQFVRFAAVLAARGARTVVECPRSLHRLLHAMPGVGQWWVEGDEPPEFDCYVPLMSVPGLLGTTIADIPAIPYLTAEPERVAHWRRRLDAGGHGLRVGLVWQGSAIGGRSMPLAELAPLAGVPGVRLISLQKGDGLEQLAALPSGMRVETLGEDFDAGPDAFVDTAAVVSTLDLVVSVDTSVGHVAGALGRPVWLALTSTPDWRWFLGREDTPWYPRTRLFRQPHPGDWGPVATAMAAALSRLAAGAPPVRPEPA